MEIEQEDDAVTPPPHASKVRFVPAPAPEPERDEDDDEPDEDENE